MRSTRVALFTLSSDILTRDRDGVNKTFSGMMKLLFPANNATEAEVEEILHLAAEGRKRVKAQLLRIDSTYPETDFSFTARDGRKVVVKTLEETEYRQYYHKLAPTHDEPASEGEKGSDGVSVPNAVRRATEAEEAPIGLSEGHKVFS